MKVSTAALFAWMPLTVGAFAPTPIYSSSSSSSSSSSIRSSRIKITSLASTSTPQRVPPGAAHVPDWENRPGLSPSEYMASDMDKPDLSGMWECPLTRWNSEGYVQQQQQQYSSLLRCHQLPIHFLSRKITTRIYHQLELTLSRHNEKQPKCRNAHWK